MSGDLSLDPDTTRSWGDREWLDTTTGYGASNDHLALLYADRAEQLTTVAAYVRRGMARDERCLYVADDNSTRAVRTALEESGVDVEAALDAGALSIVTAEEAWLDAGSFSRSAAAEFWDDALDRAQQEGFDGLRVAKEMTWALDAGVGLDSLVSYEHALNPQYAGADYTVLCQYSRDRFPSETVEAVASAHPLLVDGATVRHNARYQPAEPDGAADAGCEDAAPEQPREAATPDAPTPSAAPPPVGSTVRVLLVDDDPDYADMVGECLRSNDDIDEVVTETDPRRAARRLEDGSFDCVVSDYEMPGLDGLELLDLVREDHPDLPFLMLTARGDEEVAVDAISAGITGYFRKRGSTGQYAKLAHRISSVVSRHRAERKAAATRRQYTRLAEESTDVIAVLDEHWRIEYLSPAAERQFGHPPETLVGDVVFDHLHPADRNAARDRLAALTHGSRESVAAEFRFRQRDGSWLWVEARGRNLLDDPDVRGLIVHVRDISEQKERRRDLRESERRFRSLFEDAFDAMVITDDEGGCVDANPAACELFELSCKQLLDRSLAGFVPDGHDAEWPRRASRAPDQARGTVPLRTATGTRRVVEFAATPDVVPGRHLFVLRDVTDREQYEQMLTALHDSSREFLAAESRTDVTETVVDTATEVLSMPVVAVYLSTTRR
ncbi:MAG: PAS sensor histidine kinase, partial [uncultured archaeon A07HB70]